MNLAEFQTKLPSLLASEPLERAARARFAPHLGYGRHFGPASHDARPAAVIVVFCQDDDGIYLPLTLRPSHMKDHAGQISLPGGVREKGESTVECALRELQEEIGLEPHSVEVVGQLSDLYVFASNYWVTPIVGVHQAPAQFDLNPAEVASLIRLPLPELMRSENYGAHLMRRNGLAFQAPHIAYQGHQIWGATSMILGELIGRLERS